MLIDFHTHIFPDELAPKAIGSLKKGMQALHGWVLPSYADGTAAGLMRSMDEEGVDVSVALPIATKPSQTAGINRFARSVTGGRIVSFAAVHPAQEDWEETLHAIAEAGFPGIKLHPEFQNFYIDSPEAIRVMRLAGELGLIVVFHAGEDVGFDTVHTEPERIRSAADACPDTTLVAAHMGGMNRWEGAAKYLADTGMRFDTAFVQTSMEEATFRDLLSAFGADRILFASDSPWSRPVTDTLAFLKRAGLAGEDLEKVTFRNAAGLLGLDITK